MRSWASKTTSSLRLIETLEVWSLCGVMTLYQLPLFPYPPSLSMPRSRLDSLFFSCFFSIIYTSTYFHSRITLWDQLSSFSENYITPEGKSCLVGGDFNEVLRASEKFEGSRINLNRSNLFMNYLNHCQLIDLGFRGSKFTWSNMRYRNRQVLILERLDRCLDNDLWIPLIP